MDVREKLVELVHTIYNDPRMDFHDLWEMNQEADTIAEIMIENGVTVQERGEWVYDHWCEFKCSVCGEFSSSKPYKGRENYCSNCGAKMMPQPPKGE